jgi:hypothetical protein
METPQPGLMLFNVGINIADFKAMSANTIS